MSKSIAVILLDSRKESAVQVQKVLTAWGCNIKTRLGIHDGVLDDCANEGLVILELVGEVAQNEEFIRKLNLIKDVKAKLVTLDLAKQE